MKKKNFIIIGFISILIIFLRMINVLQIENGLGKPFIMIILIIIFSFIAIFIQKKIDNNYENKEINYGNLDILKYIAAILILILHLRPFKNYSDQLDLAFNNIITRVCVPIFFLITGYFVAKKEKEKKNYIKDYIKKQIPTYINWSIIYIPIILLTILLYMPDINNYISSINIPFKILIPLCIILSPIILLVILLYTGIYYHLWYFPAVLLSLFVLNKWKKKFSIKSLLIISFILLLFGATETYYGVLPIEIKHIIGYYYKIFFTTRNFLFFGLFYVVLGYYLGSKREIYSKYCFEKLIFSFIILIFEAIFLHSTKRLNSNILISCVPLVYYLFISIVYVTKNRKLYFNYRDYSKYYYLIHPMIVLLFSFNILNNNINPLLQILVVLGITHIISLIIIHVKKYKFVQC